MAKNEIVGSCRACQVGNFVVYPIGETFNVTIADFAKANKLEYLQAQGLIKYLELQGLAAKVSKKKNLGGRGKPADIYEIAKEVNLKLAA